jgi:murein DD-endopeptidase MepM/ murein hydrolase activator NlpD
MGRRHEAKGPDLVNERRRHAPVARSRTARLAGRPATQAKGLPQVYLGRGRTSASDIYDADHSDQRSGGRYRWVLSTFLAAGVGAVAISVAILGSFGKETGEVMMPDRRARPAAQTPNSIREIPGLNWAALKTDRLQITSGATMAKHIIHEQITTKKDGRTWLANKPYIRMVAKLTPVPPANDDVIPAFNPVKLYAATGKETARPEAPADTDSMAGRKDVAVQVVELLGGIFPNPGEDGQELDGQEVGNLVAKAQEAEGPAAIRPGFQVDGTEGLLPRNAAAAKRAREPIPPNTTVITKAVAEAEDATEDLERREQRVVRAGRGDTLTSILTKLGAETGPIKELVDQAKSIFADNAIAPGYEVHVALVPSLTNANKLEPVRVSVFADGHLHKLTVQRNAAGELEASATPLENQATSASVGDGQSARASSLYSSLYNAGLVQGMQPDSIMQILRIHAYETDFRRRIRGSDQVEYFFDVKDDAGIDSPPGELLYTSITTGGEAHRYWRFRTPDGIVDYYDEFGNNSKKFLMRRPIRAENVRLVSGFGFRFHPLLNMRRMHTGVDWAAPIGTPIMAAGNGVVEEAKHKGDYGIYARISHANGYTTAYGHMSRFGPGIAVGAKVRQGQVIGYIGMTGLTQGPHVHYEVLINSRHVDPSQLQVPQERRLDGRQLAEFQKERARVDDLMRRPPVLTQTKS